MTYLHPAQLYLFISIVFFFLLSFSTIEQAQNADLVLEDEFNKGLVLNVGDSTSLMTNDSAVVDSILSVNSITIDTSDFDGMIFFKNFDPQKIDSLNKINASQEELLKSMGVLPSDGWVKRYISSQILKFYLNKGKGYVEKFYSAMSLVLFISMPIFALFLKLLYFRKGPFVYHLVFTLNFFSILFIGLVLNVIFSLVNYLPDGLIILIYLSVVFHLFLSIKYFYKQGYIVTIMKSLVLVMLFTIVIIPMSAILMGVFSFLLY